MNWRVEWDERARRELRKFDPAAQKQILGYMRARITTSEDPRRFGSSLSGEFAGLWRYRIGGYRVICHIQDESMLVLVLRAGHRKEIYR